MSALNNSLSNLGISNCKFTQQELYPQIHSHSYYEHSLMVKQIILIYIFRKKIVVVQLRSCVWLFATPWTVYTSLLCPSLSLGVCSNLSIESMIPSNHLILSSLSPPAFNLSQHQGLFHWGSSLHQVAKDWSFSFSISPSNEHPGLISSRMDWFDLLAVQGTLKSLL